MALKTKQIVGIIASLALVGGATIYFIHKKSAEPLAPKKPVGKKRLTPSPHAHRAPAHVAPHAPPQSYAQQPSPYAFHQPAAPTQYSPFVQHGSPPPVTYTPAPPPQATHAHEWPRAVPSGHEDAAALPSQTHWSDLVNAMGIQRSGGRLISVREAQHYLNALHIPKDALKEDNILGHNTSDALSIFQESHQIPMTGQLDRETSAALLYNVFSLASKLPTA